MFYTYILKSLKDGRTYVGYSFDVHKRFQEHNNGRVRSTRYRRPFKILFTEEFENEQEAKKRELYWKSGAGRRELKKKFKELCA